MERNKISHDNFSERVKDYQGANENVAFFGGGAAVTNEEGAEKFFNMWKNSSGHDKNMRSTTVNQGAVAVSKKNTSYYSTMINVKV